MKKNKGITLVALIITIIIMLILVAVSVNVLIKNNIIGIADKTASKYKTVAEEEKNEGKIEVDGKEYNSVDEFMDEFNMCKHNTLRWEGNVDGTHSAICEKCGEIVSTEEHTYENGICTKCSVIVFYTAIMTSRDDKTTYTAKKDMTWAEWCESDYQPYETYEHATPPYEFKRYSIQNGKIRMAMNIGTTVEGIVWTNEMTTDGTTNTIVPPTDIITPGGDYYIFYYCLAWNTEISVVYEDEKGKRRIKKKKIQDLKPGDEILSFDWETMKLVPNKVKYVDGEENKTHYELDKWTFDDGTVIETVHRHEFYNVEAKRFKYMDEWKIGEHAYKQDGTKPMLVAHEVISKVVKHCTIVGEKGTNYFANDLLSGDRTCPKDIEL